VNGALDRRGVFVGALVAAACAAGVRAALDPLQHNEYMLDAMDRAVVADTATVDPSTAVSYPLWCVFGWRVFLSHINSTHGPNPLTRSHAHLQPRRDR
jgi:hypothetical protein